MKAKILIVEDDSSSRNLLVRLLKKENYEVEIASDGLEAFELMERNRFQAILTDWMMPKMDGLELIHKIRQSSHRDTVILMITALASREAKEKALEAGADDYISKPIDTKDVLKRLDNCLNRNNLESARQLDENLPASSGTPPFFAIGFAAGTGAPPAITEVIAKFRMSLQSAIFIAFNGPDWMLDSFISKLKSHTDMKVNLGFDGQTIRTGEIYVAPEDRHMVVDPTYLKIKIVDSPPENFVRPSADPLFKSLSAVFGENCIAVVLTGMGNDGSIGSGYIAAAGGYVIAQEPGTAAAPAMPRSVIELRIADIIVPLEDISRVLSERIRKVMHG